MVEVNLEVDKSVCMYACFSRGMAIGLDPWISGIAVGVLGRDGG